LEDFMAKIIYEPHPMNPARKAKLQAQGYKIIDAVFAPAGTPLHQKLDVEEIVAEAQAVIAPEVVEVVEAPVEETPAVDEPVQEAPVVEEAPVAEEAEPAAKTGKSRKE
jgi:hypothetical protein